MDSDEDVVRRPGRSGASDRQSSENEQGNTPTAQNEDTNPDNMNGDDDADLFGSDEPDGDADNNEYGLALWLAGYVS